MTTKTGSRVYRGASTRLAGGACPHCGLAASITSGGRRRRHRDRAGRSCTGGGIVVDAPDRVQLEDLPDVLMPTRSTPPPTKTVTAERDAPRRCVCGWRPRRKGDGTFEAHRIRPDDPSAPYCANGAERSTR